MANHTPEALLEMLNQSERRYHHRFDEWSIYIDKIEPRNATDDCMCGMFPHHEYGQLIQVRGAQRRHHWRWRWFWCWCWCCCWCWCWCWCYRRCRLPLAAAASWQRPSSYRSARTDA